ncbi:MAG TPA: phage baseplate assembly protein V [Longimicrobium sp.]|nr:phage baseplate assembly protein V [Longimicrobium sp.]
MEGVVGVMKRVAEHEARRILTTELGVVTAVFPHKEESDGENYQCSVQLKTRVLPDGQRMELRKVPVATPYLGMAAIPNVGDLVLVQFMGGSVNAPVITGRLYNDEDRPPPNQVDEFLVRHKLASGGSIRIDKDGKVVLTSANEENTLTVEDESISLKNEKFSLTIDFKGEKISLSSDKDLELVAKSGTLTIDANAVEIKSKSDVKIDASSGKLAIESMEAQVKASSSATIEASGAMTIKGATVDVN